MTEETELKPEKEKKIWEFIKGKFQWLVYLVLAVILYINIKIRSLPMQINPATGKPGLWDITRDNWTLGPDLDPFLFLRWAKEIVANGSLPAVDYMRYSPLGHSSLLETKVLPYTIAYFYKFLHVFSNSVTVEYAAVVLPLVASVFMAIGFFLLVRKAFEWKGNKFSNITGLLATLFLITLPSLLPRTIAGIPEKESLGFGLMFFALYFFICAWKTENIKKAIPLGVLAGLFTAIMALVWGGVLFIYAAVGIFGFIMLALGKVGKKDVIIYSSWILSSALFWLPFTMRTSFREFVTSPTTGGATFVWLMFLVYFVLFETKLKETKFLKEGLAAKIPKMVIIIVFSLIILFWIGLIFFGPTTITDLGKGVIAKLYTPYIDRLSFTVAENKQPFFSDWAQSFGPIAFGIPLFFWLFFIGSIALFFDMIKGLQKSKEIFLFGFIFSLLALIFSRTSQTSILNGSDFLSKSVYFLGFVIFAGTAYYVFHKNKDNGSLKEIRFETILLFSFILVSIIAARSGIRLIMLMSPFAAIPISYLTVRSIEKAFDRNEKDLSKLFFVIFAILILVAVPYTLYYNYQASKYSAEVHIPNQYTQQWQKAMAWVRENTPKDSVFGSWWDYGYWIQTMGERATMLDGGNSISYWDYLMGRHALTAPNESEALELLYNHNVTHFLIDSTDIGKYPAYASIGSDENYDRLSYIGSFVADDAQSKETNNQTIKVYVGSASIDEDIIMDDGRTFLPAGSSGIGALVVFTDGKGNFTRPLGIAVYRGNQYNVNLRYLYYNKKIYDFGSGLEGMVYIIPSLVQTSGGLGADPAGAAMYLSPRNLRALWVQLYLLDEGKQFNLVHTEQNPVMQDLKNQGLDVGDFLYYGGVLGPMKIWEVNYTGNESYNPEYLQRTYPDRIKDRRIAA